LTVMSSILNTINVAFSVKCQNISVVVYAHGGPMKMAYVSAHQNFRIVQVKVKQISRKCSEHLTE